jgi:hypothetical protein
MRVIHSTLRWERHLFFLVGFCTRLVLFSRTGLRCVALLPFAGILTQVLSGYGVKGVFALSCFSAYLLP